MNAAVFYGPRDIRIKEVSDPKIQHPTDAIVKVTYAAICGSDLWFYRGLTPREKGTRMGHEFMGIIEETGNAVSKVKKGDLVVVPFDFADGTCPECLAGMSSACRHGGVWASGDYDGGQGEKVRVPFANNNLFLLPKKKADANPFSFLALSDVLCTGHHVATSADVAKGKTIAVIGDGAVGLCGILASNRLHAKQIIFLSTYEKRMKLGKKFGATDIVSKRGEKAIAEVKALTNDLGVDCVLECVGTPESWETALAVVRAGGKIGWVGIPHDVSDISLSKMYMRNYGIQGGRAPVPTYLPELLLDVNAGTLDSSPIFDKTVSLNNILEGYEAMDRREAIKVVVKI